MQHRRYVSYLLAALMVTAYVSRGYLAHDREFNKVICHAVDHNASNDARLVCNCPICHAEDVVATPAESFEYHPFVAIIECEYGVLPTASANDIVISSSLRGPPCLS